jgi:hypothetical protein
MEKDRSFAGIGIGIVILVIIVGSLLYLGTFNLAAKSPGYAIGSSEAGMAQGAGYGNDYYGYNSPTYHVFNYFNSGALSVMLVLGIIIALAMVDRLYKKTDSLMAAILYIIGTLLIFSSATIFIFGVHDLMTFNGPGETYTKPTIMQQYGWLIESVVFGLLGAGFVWAAEFIRKREEEEGSILYLVITPVASLLVLFTIPVFMFGISSVIFAGSYSKPTFEWLIETVIFGGLAVLTFNKIDKIRFSQGEKESWRLYPLFAAGYAFLAPAFFMFIMAATQVLSGSEYGNDNIGQLFAEVIVFGILGSGAFYVIDRIRKKENEKRSAFPLALVPAGYLFMLIATGYLVSGFSMLIRASITASNYRSSFGMIADVLLFGLLGYFALKFGDELENRAEKAKRNLPAELGICGILLWIVSLGFYLGVVETFLGSQPDTKLLLEFIVYGGIGLGLVVYSDGLRRSEGFPKDRNLPRLLALSGGLLLLITLLVFIAGLHGWLYSTNPEFTWLGRVVGYGAFGALYFWLGNSMEPVLPKKEKKAKAKILEKSAEKAEKEPKK